MDLYKTYLTEIEHRKSEGLHPKPIDDAKLLKELINHIKNPISNERENCINFFIYNTLPGTTSAATEKAKLLKEIIVGKFKLEEVSPEFAFILLSHMKGGPSIEVLIDLALGKDSETARRAANVLMKQVFLYEADIDRIKESYESGNNIAKDILISYSKAEFFTALPEIDEEIDVVTYVAAEGDISTDLLSPGNQAHSRSDRELHGKCFISENAQEKILELKKIHPSRRIMLIAVSYTHLTLPTTPYV